jgi:hypothetical protein
MLDARIRVAEPRHDSDAASLPRFPRRDNATNRDFLGKWVSKNRNRLAGIDCLRQIRLEHLRFPLRLHRRRRRSSPVRSWRLIDAFKKKEKKSCDESTLGQSQNNLLCVALLFFLRGPRNRVTWKVERRQKDLFEKLKNRVDVVVVFGGKKCCSSPLDVFLKLSQGESERDRRSGSYH